MLESRARADQEEPGSKVILQGQVNQWVTYRYKIKYVFLTPQHLILSPSQSLQPPKKQVQELRIDNLHIVASKKPQMLVI